MKIKKSKDNKVVPKFLWGASTLDWQNEASAFMRFKENDTDRNTDNKNYYIRDRK